MATKKSASTVKKKPVAKKASAPVAKTTTKVTTVRAAAAPRRRVAFSFSSSPVLAASIAEFVGTFLLTAVVLSSQGSAIVVFFALMAIVLAVGAISGAYVNPLLTVGAWATRRLSNVRAASYLVAQVLGAMMALVVVNGFVSAAPQVSQQSAMFGQQSATLFKASALVEGKEWYVLAAELLGATIFAFAVAAAARETSRTAKAFGVAGGLLVALVVATYCVSTIGMGGAILNPAVAGAVQALAWKVWPIMIYVVTPLIGGILGFMLHDMISEESRV